MNWRWYLFWIKDWISGGMVRKVYDELVRDDKKLDLESRNNKINKLLTLAKNESSFYKDYDENDIKSFPVINKQIIKDNFDDIFVKKYDKEKLHKMSTSGSTGTPFTVYQNSEKRSAVLAEILFFGKKTNYEFGEKQVFTRIWTDSNKKNTISKFLQNMVPYDISYLNESNLERLDKVVRKKKVKCMLGYASSFDKYYDFLKKRKVKGKYYLKSIISGTELLNENTREGLSKLVGCNVYSRYSNQENGLLGQDNGKEKRFWLNETDYYFEFLKLDSDEPAKEGEIARIVITDLFNYAQPMIRYDTGDLCRFSTQKGKQYIEEIHGRKRDLIFDTKGNPIEAATISVNFWNIKNIIQFQFIQETKNEYRILLNVESEFEEEDEVIELFEKLLGENAVINIEYVNEISVLDSGKRKAVINNYKIV